jgi:hypothetical protein
MRRFLLLALGLAWAGVQHQAHAQDRPATIPTRDVDVTYRMADPTSNRTLEQRMRWQGTTQRLRVDSPSPGLWMLVDYRTRRLAMVVDPERRVLDTEAPAGAVMPGQLTAASFARRGQDTVAGQPCTEWETRDTTSVARVVCLTTDGVLLRLRRIGADGPPVMMEAVRVLYGPQDPAAFVAPAGYAHAAAPASPGSH